MVPRLLRIIIIIIMKTTTTTTTTTLKGRRRRRKITMQMKAMKRIRITKTQIEIMFQIE